MLNDIIKIDLHIHSKASDYKDGEIVSNSTIENLPLLINKLNENDISLCSITDHNRFDYDLYKSLHELILSNEGSLTNCLPGIEFDVQLEKEKPKCHIIAIFNDKDQEKLKHLEEKMFDIEKLESKDGYYTVEKFEAVLKNIGLDTILIVHQRQGINNENTSTASLSGACSNPSKFIQIGYINCLEYNKPNVEGILKNSIKDIGLHFPIITGSDCHEWIAYPYHDSSSEKFERDFTKFKCLPTFKGLLMSITSFDTRVNRIKNNNNNYIKSLKLNSVDYPLTNGINAIIGDNGAGKTLIAQFLGENAETYYKQIIKNNGLNKEVNGVVKYNCIKQNQIVTKVRDGKLFDGSTYFDSVATKDLFSKKINTYFNSIYTYVMNNIEIDEKKKDLKNTNYVIEHINSVFYWPMINSNITLEDFQDDNNRISELNNILISLKSEIDDYSEYYKERKLLETLIKSYNELNDVYKVLVSTRDSIKIRNKVRTIVKNKLNDFKTKIDLQSSSDDINRKNQLENKKSFINKVKNYCKATNKKIEFPSFPDKISGRSCKEQKGYNFIKVTKYDNVVLKEEFYNECFNDGYHSEESLKNIKTRNDFSSALTGYNLEKIKDYREKTIGNFIKKYSSERTEISEIVSKKDIGNTPGEISLVYYKFIIEEDDDKFDVLIIDQPEDDINPNRIRKYLNTYLSSLKDKKQVILVTHNPLLVVNLDVDNVLYVNKVNDKIQIKAGSLEYENDDYSILDLVKENLDGGYEAVERRLKAYGRNDN